MILKGAIKVSQAMPKTNKPLTNQQKLESLRAKNPKLNLLISKLDLDTDLEI